MDDRWCCARCRITFHIEERHRRNVARGRCPDCGIRFAHTMTHDVMINGARTIRMSIAPADYAEAVHEDQ